MANWVMLGMEGNVHAFEGDYLKDLDNVEGMVTVVDGKDDQLWEGIIS